MAKRENEYQAGLIKRIRSRFPGAFVMKNDEGYIQGVPDLTILFGPFWAVLEVKRDKKARDNPEPNQEHYVQLLDDMGFSAFIYPSVEEDVLDAMERSFKIRWATCVVEPKQVRVGQLRRRQDGQHGRDGHDRSARNPTSRTG